MSKLLLLHAEKVQALKKKFFFNEIKQLLDQK